MGIPRSDGWRGRSMHGRRRLPPDGGTGHPRPADRRREPRDPPGTLAAEVERASRHYKPLSVAFIDIDRSSRSTTRTDTTPATPCCAGGGGPLRIDPRQRHLRPLRRRGVHADPARDPARGRSGSPRSCGRSSCRSSSRSPATRTEGDDQHRHRRRSRIGAPARHARRPGRCGDVRGEVARQEPRLPVPRARRGVAGPPRADLGRAQAQATAIGQWANDTATQALASVLAPQPQHRGRPRT